MKCLSEHKIIFVHPEMLQMAKCCPAEVASVSTRIPPPFLGVTLSPPLQIPLWVQFCYRQQADRTCFITSYLERSTMMKEKPCPEEKCSKVKKTEEENNSFQLEKIHGFLSLKLSKPALLLRREAVKHTGGY